jgi:hypothetical protein
VFSTRPLWRRWCQSSERRPCGPPRPPTPQASRCALASPVVGRPRSRASADRRRRLPSCPRTTFTLRRQDAIHPTPPARPPGIALRARQPDRDVTRKVPRADRDRSEAFWRRSTAVPIGPLHPPCCCVLSPSAAPPCHCRQSAAVDLVPHHGVVSMHLFEQLPTLLLNSGRETTRRLVPLRTACPLMCIPDRLSPVIWTISSIRSKGSSGKFQSWFWTSG